MKAKEGQVLMKIDTTRVDTAALFKSDEAKLALLNDAIDSRNANYIAHALGILARAEGGLSWLSRKTGQRRQSLHKSLGEHGNPSLGTLLPVLEALGLQLRVVKAPASRTKAHPGQLAA